MRFSELYEKLKSKLGKFVAIYKWWIDADASTPFPHAVIAKLGSGEGLYADNGFYFPTAKIELYLAMLDDSRQEEYEESVDNALDSLEISYSWRMGYNREENLIIKIYEFEIPTKQEE